MALYRTTVNWIAKQRMTDRGEVNSDLMSPPRLEPTFDQRRIIQNAQPSPMGHGPSPAMALDDGDLLAIGRRPSKRGIDGSLACLGQAADDGQITAVDRMSRKLLGEPFVRDIGLGDHQQPGRALVDPMHDAG